MMNTVSNDNSMLDIKEYNIIKKIARGKFSAIYLVENKSTRKQYVAKVNLVKSADFTDEQKQFISREVGILMKIKHSTLIDFYGFSYFDFCNNKNMTILMDYIKNDSLAKIIEKQQQKNMPAIYDNTKRQIILAGISYGMMKLHEHRILHRDLKPENIFIDEKFRPIISDFGLTKFFDPQNSASDYNGPNYVECAYLSPEVIKGNHFNQKSDVYSFGILMYEVINGCRCYSNFLKKGNKSNNQSQLKYKIMKGLRPEFKNPIKKGLRQLIERCWSLNPSDRPTFSELFNKLSLTAEEFECPSNELFTENDEDEHKYCLENVDINEVVSYVDEIQRETDDSESIRNEYETKIESIKSDYQAEIDELKSEVNALESTVKTQSDEIQSLMSTIKMQNDKINTSIENEHTEVQIMRDFLLKQVRNEFLVSKQHSRPEKLLSTLDVMFADSNVFKLFTSFCETKMCTEYIMYVTDMAAYYNMKEDLKPLLFYDFRDKYFKDGAPYFLNIKASMIKEVRDAKVPSPELLDKALELVYTVFRIELIREFKHSSQYSIYFLNPKGKKKKLSKRLSKINE